jgi:hypothetical protein
VKHFYTNWEWVEMLTGCFSVRQQPGCDGANARHRSKRFIILATNHWPLCQTDESPSQYNGGCGVLGMANERLAVRILEFTQRLCCFVSDELICYDKHPWRKITAALIQKWKFWGKWQIFTVNWSMTFLSF